MTLQREHACTRSLGFLLLVLISVVAPRVARAQSVDVGVIPNKPGACPPGSEYVWIFMDDEDTKNLSKATGWTGAIRARPKSGGGASGTEFGFCRVDGSKFGNLPAATFGPVIPPAAYSYAVLKLGSACPKDSIEVNRQIENETSNNQNDISANATPNFQSFLPMTNYPWVTNLYLCLFTSTLGPLHMAEFPDLGITYGVFGGRTSPPQLSGHRNFWLQKGQVHTDDEDSPGKTGNYNKTTMPNIDDKFSNDVLGAMEALSVYGDDSDFYTAMVRRLIMPCDQTVTWHDGSERSASFDGENCFVAKAPSGSVPFVWDNGFYLKPTAPQQCPLGSPIKVGTLAPVTFCIVLQAPKDAFIWNNGFYTKSTSGGCPSGSSWDGANCFYMKAPWPTTALLFNGNFASTSIPTCADGVFDGHNCDVGRAKSGTTAFTFDGGYYYSQP